MTNGIDVSKWNGDIDWKKVKAAGIGFAILRAGYGRRTSQKDPYFESNYQGAKAAGLGVGAYWYSYATSTAQAKEEAKAFLTVIQGKTFEYPLFFDQEYEPTILALTSAQRTAICNAFLGAVQAAGYVCGLYSSEDFYTNKLLSAQLTDGPRWIAKYGERKPKIGGTVDIWQYTGSGSVSGVTGSVDRNRCYTDYAVQQTETASVTKEAEKKEEEIVTQQQFDTMLEDYLSRRAQQPASDWAQASLDACKEKGILVGDEDGNLRPRSFVTREELAAVAERLG